MAEPPDFVIAGAAKCGTTALFEYLARHPSVFTPHDKEPGFFSADIPGGMASLADYRALFAAAPAHCLKGEASTRYLYSRVAIERLINHNPHVKVIVILRNPVDAAYSLHGYAYRYGHEGIADFERAWHAQAPLMAAQQRALGGQAIEYDYSGTYRYGEQLRRVFEWVPTSQRYVAVYEEFFADPARHYAEVLEFLGLAARCSDSFPIVNSYVGVRSSAVESLLRRPPALVRRLYAPLRPIFEAAGLHPARLVRRMNWGRRSKPDLRPQFREELERFFAADIAELESLLGRRLWGSAVGEHRAGRDDPTQGPPREH